MNTNKKVWLCLIGNIITMMIVIIIVSIFKDDNGKYFRIGPQKDLIVISVQIDTWFKWTMVLLFIGFIKGCDVLVNELGSPILGFRIYDPDCKTISDFTKNELNFLANAMWFTNSFRGILMIVINITQFDIALFGMCISEFVSIFTIRHLLSEKTFTSNTNYDKINREEIDIELIEIDIQ